MALFDFLRRRPDIETKTVYDDAKYMQSSISLLDASNGRGKIPPFSMQRSVQSFESWVYAAAMLNAQAVSSVPLRLYVRSGAQSDVKIWNTRKVSNKRKAYLLGDHEQKPSQCVMKSAVNAGDFEEVTDAHPILEILRKANPYEDGFQMSVLRILYLELTGNAYLNVVTDKVLNIPSQLYSVPAQNVTIIPSKTELIEAYLYGTNSQSMQRFELDEIIHFKRPNPRNLYYGLGKVEAAYGAIQQSQAAHAQDLSFLENMSRPDYAAIVKGGASEQSMRRFEESMRSLHQGVRKSGRMVTISGDIQLTPLNFPAKDLTGRDDIVEEIAAVFGVPVSMLKANDPNLASAQTGYSMWRETTIAPICRMDEETLNSKLLPLFGIHEDAYLAYDNPVPENRLADSQERSQAVAGGWRTPNEARLEEGYEALDISGADSLRGLTPSIGSMPFLSSIPSTTPKPVEGTSSETTSIEEISKTALNGAQISSLLSIIEQVGIGILPKSSAQLIAESSFPSIPSSIIASMLAPIVEGTSKPVEPTSSTTQEKSIEESDDAKQERLTNARIKIASLEAKAWDAVHQQPQIDALTKELDAVKERNKSLDEVLTLLTEVMGDEVG